MTSERAGRSVRFGGCVAAALGLALGMGLFASSAQAQRPDCKALARRIADFDKRSNSSLSDRYDRAARKQRDEIDRTVSYGEQSGCWAQGLDETPSAMCRQLDARLARMHANLDDLQSRADEASRSGWDGGDSREALVYDYDLWCKGIDTPADLRQAPLERIPPDETTRIDGDLSPGSGVDLKITEGSLYGGGVDANTVALCVRTCDGGYFPLTAPVKQGHLENLQALCAAQCPAVEAKLYTMKKGEDVAKALSTSGDFYASLPNAFKFRKKYDPACACKPAGKQWGQVLTEAERLLEQETGKTDKQVSTEQAEALARPPGPPALRRGDADAAAGQLYGRGGKPKASAAPATVAPVAPVAAASTPAPAAPAPTRTEESGDYREIVGADGVKRRVRIVGPKQ